MQFGIREQHVFWGMRDYLLPGGVLAVSVPCLTYPPSTSSATGDGYTEGGWCVGWRKVLVNMPPGLFEDALFRLCNSIEPVSFVLSDLQHPLPTPARVLIYTAAQVSLTYPVSPAFPTPPVCPATLPPCALVSPSPSPSPSPLTPTLPQVVALFLYVFCDDFPGADIVVGIAFSPVVLLVQNWLYYMLHCPCLTNKHGRPNMLGRKGTVLARAMGRILALPVTVGLLFMLVHIAHRIANGKDGDILGLYIANGIVVTFLLLLLLDSMSFWWFAPKLKVQVCGYVLLEVNKWTLERERDEADISWGGGGGADAQCVTIDPCCCCCSCRCCGCNRPPEVAPPEVELVSVEVSVECV
ncbi:hypothetical protein B484DRAFT_453854 [Ochromonadaceae sp. CCMP2298]|nr:hypothetical protein B484DRAFT_453854 [Ochromonadaceae sp. CCMP2298]